ncbi:MAG TPA: hypothetical protein DCQ26_04680 [Marinilabiliales bacterium]|nr:MAG: hypothetical protein A2W95_10680 [Bacteroidetes bacterium GWA2_40_14]OFX93620.1 MAG: hypothetical protein A2W97_07795 [Bacteroidetes bacterium GWE2_40_63]OFZ28277.1 MAG: hypothetical protein A2437_00030 [Bacteroidetes bacterium RIFOXYC2_FULL_40_12]HAM97885.1 hypothetical protein [Marinilabiliales bacterium]HAZ04234.1 hypothetical protein [Marinilabiliales bacterium]
MRYCILIATAFVILLGSNTISGQAAKKNDSLNKVLSNTKDPHEKVDIILSFLDNSENKYADNARDLAGRAYEIAQQSNNAEGRVKSMIFLSTSYFRSGDYQRSMELAQKTKDLAEDLNFDKELARCFRLIGQIYHVLGDYDNSSHYFFKCLNLVEKFEDQEGISHSLGDIGACFVDQHEYKKALEYFNNSLTIALEINSLHSIKREYNNIAVVYGSLQKYDSAIIFLRKAQEINIKLGDKLGMGTNVMNIGYNQMNQGDLDEALISFQQALDLFSELGNQLHIAECYLNFGFCYQLKNKMDESIDYFKKALSVGQKNNYYRIIYPSAKILSQIYLEKNDTISAYIYSLPEKLANDSLYTSQKQALLSKLELQYKYEKKEFERQLDQKEKNIIILVIMFGLVSGLLVLGLLFTRFRLKSKLVVIEKEKIESELTMKDRELTVNLISLIKKNEMISDISNKLTLLENSVKSTETKEIIAKMSRNLRNSADDKMFNEFSRRFQEVHIGFYEKLIKTYPDITPNELKLCAFLRLNMSTKDISELTGQQITSIAKARHRLRQKLAITGSDTNLVTFLSQI